MTGGRGSSMRMGNPGAASAAGPWIAGTGWGALGGGFAAGRGKNGEFFLNLDGPALGAWGSLPSGGWNQEFEFLMAFVA